MELRVTSERVVKASETCGDAARVLKELFPEAFDYPGWRPKAGELFYHMNESVNTCMALEDAPEKGESKALVCHKVCQRLPQVTEATAHHQGPPHPRQGRRHGCGGQINLSEATEQTKGGFKMKVILMSSGKHAVLSGQVSADLYIDCRGMVNPLRDPVLGHQSGDSKAVQDWIWEHNRPYVTAAINMIHTAIKSAPTRNGGSGLTGPLTVCFFCLAGIHRSKGLKHVVAGLINEPDIQVEVQ